MKSSRASRCSKLLRKGLYVAIAAILSACIAFSEDKQITVSCPLVIRDSHGNVVHNLAPEDFESSLPIVSLVPDPRQRRVVVVLDASGSMLGNPVTGDWKLETDFLSQLARQAGENTKLALLIFNSEVTEILDFSAGNASVLARMESVSTDPHYRIETCRDCRTPLYDALAKGASLFSHPSQADTLLVITDGMDTASKTSPKRLSAFLAANRVRLFAVVISYSLGYRSLTPDELTRSAADLRDVVDRSGGTLFGPMEWIADKHLFHVASLTDDMPIAEGLRHFYAGFLESDLISVRLPESYRQGSRWKLKLAKAAQSKVRNAHLEYPPVPDSCSAVRE